MLKVKEPESEVVGMGGKTISDGKKVIQKMKAHAGSETHTGYIEAELLARKIKINNNHTSFITCSVS